MKRSDAAAISVGTLTALVVGITGSMLFPAVGLIAGAYFSATAAFGAGLGMAAAGALGAAGAIGGLAVGKFSKPLAVWTGVALGVVLGGVTKAMGVVAGVFLRLFSRKKISSPAAAEKSSGIFSWMKSAFKKLKPRFDARASRVEKNQAAAPAAPARKETPAP